MAKKTNAGQQELAKILYMSGLQQDEILQKVPVTRQTLSRWINANGWKEQRAAKTITRPQLINSILQSISKMMEDANKPGNEDKLAGLGDKLIKAATAIQKLEKSTSVVDRIDSLIDFENWLMKNKDKYPAVTPEMINLINTMHSDYLNSHFNAGGHEK